ncbi:MAG: succinate dehydrogenase, hydrophobic membrane anchor protein [Thiomicrorhabdus sp.]|nr:succinate dehydrogenase, hydrophobic membrane anchor protein [Thiomicrorhabdus sp.]
MNDLNLFGKPLTGVKAHKWQRISAIYLMLYFPYLAWQIHWLNSEKANDIIQLMTALFTPIFLLFSLIALAMILVHAWVGMRDIIIDYIPQQRVTIWLTLYALFLLFIVFDLLFLAITLSSI